MLNLSSWSKEPFQHRTFIQFRATFHNTTFLRIWTSQVGENWRGCGVLQSSTQHKSESPKCSRKSSQTYLKCGSFSIMENRSFQMRQHLLHWWSYVTDLPKLKIGNFACLTVLAPPLSYSIRWEYLSGLSGHPGGSGDWSQIAVLSVLSCAPLDGFSVFWTWCWCDLLSTRIF